MSLWRPIAGQPPERSLSSKRHADDLRQPELVGITELRNANPDILRRHIQATGAVQTIGERQDGRPVGVRLFGNHRMMEAMHPRCLAAGDCTQNSHREISSVVGRSPSIRRRSGASGQARRSNESHHNERPVQPTGEWVSESVPPFIRLFTSSAEPMSAPAQWLYEVNTSVFPCRSNARTL